MTMTSSKSGPLQTLGPQEIETLVKPLLLKPLPVSAYDQLAQYLHLLYRWNERMNLTAVRDPALMVGLHFAECIRCAQKIPESSSTLLDFGSGAGLPGIPIQITRPDLAVTLAEAQTRKAAFLHEAVRELNLKTTTVYSGRVELMPPDQRYDIVTLRAVDNMAQAISNARPRITNKGCCIVLTSSNEATRINNIPANLVWKSEAIPNTRQRILLTGCLEN